MRTIVEPALRGWEAVIVAPDVPDESWATERSERAVLALLDDVLESHAIDRERILITGFSMGGRGSWYLASRRPERFTGVIVMATGPGRERLENLADMPLYIIHSPDDEVVPYGPVEELAIQLAERGYPVQMMRLAGASHGMMGDYVGPLRAAGDWMWAQWSQ
jgi:predicted peptidase